MDGHKIKTCQSLPMLLTGLVVLVASCEYKLDSRSANRPKSNPTELPPTREDPSNSDNDNLAPILADLDAKIYAEGLSIPPLYFANTGSSVKECTISPPLPQGLAIEVAQDSCQITGVPTESKPESVYTITAKSEGGKSDSAEVKITVRVGIPPVLDAVIAPQMYTATVSGSAYDFANSGDDIIACAISPNLPAGLTISIHNGSCRISGTATESRAATDYTVTATAIDGSMDTTTINITVQAANPPILASQGTKSFTSTIAIAAINFPNTGAAIVSCSVSPNLPNGLTLNVNTCEITGTPTVASAATTYNVTATAADGSQGSASVSISVTAATPPILADAGTKNFVATVTISAFNFTNTGGAITSCSVSPALPAGLSLNTATCEISGNPTGVTSNTYTVTATAADSTSDTATVTINVVAANPPNISNQAAKNFVTTVEIDTFDFANSGAAISSCSISPNLPNGLTLNTSTCEISGTPTVSQAATTYTVTATAVDNSQDTATVDISIATANPALLTNAGNQSFVNTVASTYDFAKTGGDALSCSVSPALPAGLSVTVHDDSCRISGTPSATQGATNYNVTSTASDGSKSTASINLTIVAANPPLLVDIGSTQTLDKDQAITTIIFTNNGANVVSCVAETTLPAGLSVSATTTCEISGTPTVAAALAEYTIRGTAADGSSDTAKVSISVSGAAISCPGGYIAVESYSDADIGTVPAFCVMKYEAKNDGSLNAISQATGIPWASINRDDAISTCQATSDSGFTFDLITNTQWQSIGRQIETFQSSPGVYVNWSNNSNNADNFMNAGNWNFGPQPAGADNDPCINTTNINCADNTHSDFLYKRTHTLPNGEVIWDFSEGLWEWVKDDSTFEYLVNGIAWSSVNASDGNSCTAPGCTGPQGKAKAAFGPIGDYLAKTSTPYGGLGFFASNTGGTIFRGGDCLDTGAHGIFSTCMSYGPTNSSAIVGFRCTAIPVNPPVLSDIGGTHSFEKDVDTASLSFANSGAAATGCSISPALPSGLSASVDTSVTPHSCKITGIPSVPNVSTLYTVTATANDGSTDTATVTIEVTGVPNTLTCPTGYIAVDQYTDADTGTVPAFCVMKYEAKNDGANNALSQAAGNPWTWISRDTAITKCQGINESGYTGDLISNAQWQSIARQIELYESSPGVYANWQNQSTAGANAINRGNTDSENPLAADNDDSNGCAGTSSPSNCNNAWHINKRTHTLPNGNVIWDLSGNVSEWVKENSLFNYGVGYMAWSSILAGDGNECLTPLCTGPQGKPKAAFGPFGDYSSKTNGQLGGLGHTYSLDYPIGAIHRGGPNVDLSTVSGIFAVQMDYAGDGYLYSLGFRCVVTPQ